MTSQNLTAMTIAGLYDALALWTGRTRDARRRGSADLVAGCRRNLRAVEREIARRAS